MQLTLIFIAISFIILSVWYADRMTARYESEKALFLRVGIILVVVLLALWVIDVIVFSNLKLLHEKTRDEIIAMIRYLFVALVIAIIVNDKIKK